MPELPEAETIARGLQHRLPGRIVRDIAVTRPDVLTGGSGAPRLRRVLVGRRIRSVGRRGKNVLVEFDGGIRLLVNLGMTGRLVAGPAGLVTCRHVAVRFTLNDDEVLVYDDVRRFGRLELHDPESWARRDADLGMEPLSADATAERIHGLFHRSRTPVRNLLLDQTRLAGVGNIYASEALFLAGIRPTRRGNRLTRQHSARLLDGLRQVLEESILARGTTLNDYRDAGGEKGGFQDRLRVYGRAGLPCRRCGTPIRRIVLTNRSAFFCPRCQR